MLPKKVGWKLHSDGSFTKIEYKATLIDADGNVSVKRMEGQWERTISDDGRIFLAEEEKLFAAEHLKVCTERLRMVEVRMHEINAEMSNAIFELRLASNRVSELTAIEGSSPSA